MSAAEALRAARTAGIEVEVDGNSLLLEATSEPPAVVLASLSRHKTEIIALLRPGPDGWSAEDWQVFFDERAAIAEFDGVPHADAEAQAFERCIVEWLNRNPTPSAAARCLWCGQSESPGAVVVPYGTELGTHAWLHPECWPGWHDLRQSRSREALARMGILADACSVRGGCSSSMKEAPSV
jgi:hypothetical protein